MTVRKTKIEKLLARLETGKNLTAREAQNRLGLPHLSKRIYDLREQGLTIHTNKINVKGELVTAYRLAA